MDEKNDCKKPFKSDASNSHCGHRERMRNRFAMVGGDSFSDHELLEMLLYWAIPQKNTNNLAHELLNRFGTFDRVLEADESALMQVTGIKSNVALYIKLIVSVCTRYDRTKLGNAQIAGKPVGEGELARYLIRYFLGKTEEELIAVPLDDSGHMMPHFFVGKGISNALEVPIRVLLREVITRDCNQVILAHNHPDGIPIPSPQDLQYTNHVAKRMEDVGILLAGHFLIAGKQYITIGNHFEIGKGKQIDDIS